MIKPIDLFHIPFYEKTHFTGSRRGMRFYIEKVTLEDKPYLRAWIFPGPFCYEKTADDKKQYKDFPFSEDGLIEIADWLNDSYEARKEDWNKGLHLI